MVHHVRKEKKKTGGQAKQHVIVCAAEYSDIKYKQDKMSFVLLYGGIQIPDEEQTYINIYVCVWERLKTIFPTCSSIFFFF